MEEISKKAVSWDRYAFPLALINLVVSITITYFLYQDVAEISGGRLVLGASSLSFLVGDEVIEIPSAVLFWAYAGFFVYYLSATQQRFMNDNIVPWFYISGAIRWVTIIFTTVIFMVLLQTGDSLLGTAAQSNEFFTRPEFQILVAFVIGFYPTDFISEIVYSVRGRLGLRSSKPIPLSYIDGIDHTVEGALRDSGVDTVQALANVDVGQLHNRTKVGKETLLGWKSQARLLHELGDLVAADRFRRLGLKGMDDIAILVDSAKFEEVSINEADLIETLRKESQDDLFSNREYWSIVVAILRNKYQRNESRD